MTSGQINVAFQERAAGPYSKAIKCRVVAEKEPVTYRGRDGEEKKSKVVAVSDGDAVIKVVVYDPNKFKYFKDSQSLMMRETIRKTEMGRSLVVTRNSKVYMSSPIEVLDTHKEQGRAIVDPPPAEKVTVKEALSSPAKKKVSVGGKIVQEDEPRTVQVRGEEVAIKTITIDDGTEKAKVTLWRDCSSSVVRPGDHIEITDVVVNYYNSQTTLQTTSFTKLVKTEDPELNRTVVVEGVSVADGKAELLLNDDSSVFCNTELLQAALATSEMPFPDVEMACSAGPLNLQIISKETEVAAVNKI